MVQSLIIGLINRVKVGYNFLVQVKYTKELYLSFTIYIYIYI